MERVDLPILELSLIQKLDLMERLWAELSQDEEHLESPAWHESVLKQREEALASGKATLSDWEEAKIRIRKKIL